MARLTVPTVHLNGTSREALMDAYTQAHDRLSEAWLAVGETAPNARDYYVQGPGAYRAAVLEHSDRLDRLRAVRDEIGQILEGLSNG